jgi:hypothetical protein
MSLKPRLKFGNREIEWRAQMYKALTNDKPVFEESITRAAVREFLVDNHCRIQCQNSLLKFKKFGNAIDKLLGRLDIETTYMQCVTDYRNDVEMLRRNPRIKYFLAGFIAAELPNNMDRINAWNQMLTHCATKLDKTSPTYMRLCKMAQNAFFETAFDKMMATIEVQWISMCCGSLFLVDEFECLWTGCKESTKRKCNFCVRKEGEVNVQDDGEIERNGNQRLIIRYDADCDLGLRDEEVRQDWMRQKVRMAEMAWMTMVDDLAFASDVAWLCLQYSFHYLSE